MLQDRVKRLCPLLIGTILLSLLALAGCEEKQGLMITGFSPKAGPYTGGDPVTIKGNGFTKDGSRGVVIWFGKKKGQNIRFRSDTELAVDAPPGDKGQVVDLVVIFDTAHTKKFAGAYSYIDPAEGFGVGELTGAESE